MAQKKTKSIRLPKHIIPTKYSISLIPNLDSFTFEGDEEIEIKLLRNSSSITLHAAELEIISAEIVQSKQKSTCKVSYNDKEETVTIASPFKLSPGKAKLRLKFTGILNDKLRGFYRSKYDIDGKTHHMAVTQFESTDARRAIPCFDEPAHKAVFEVTLKIPSDRTAISNTIETEIAEHEGGYKVIKFAPSPKMSSYLLAFIVGHFEFIGKKTKDGVLVRVFVTPGKKHQAQFALDVAVKCIEFYEEYFGIKYPLPVIDLIAIPDFTSGAMENWGAVTYRETAILVDPEHSSTQNKQWVALVIAHELAHQWFGNLVTMEWWTHLWLNEGFASYMEYVAIDKLFPKWNIWTQFVFIEHARGLSLDGLANTHAIEVDVNHPAEISEIFDAVSYSKGASVIRMLAEYIGETDFRRGLRNYLKKHAYSNARTSDLWDALAKTSGKPVRKIMENWTRKPGYPLIKASLEKNKLELSQSRFFSSSNIKTEDKTIWLVPISAVGPEDNKPTFFLLNKNKMSVPLAMQKWVEINTGETSFVRVSYSPDLLSNLSGPIKSKKISAEDRFGIVRDTFALSQSSSPLSTDIALKIAKHYKDEDNYIVWAELATQLLRLSSLLYDQKCHGALEGYIRNLFNGVVNRAGWNKKENENYNTTLLRSIVIYVLGTSGDEKIIKQARKLFEKGNTIDADLRGIVYRLIAENGDKKDYAKFLSLYKQMELAEEKDRLLRALCSFKQKDLIEKTLEFGFSDQARVQDLIKVFSFTFANPAGRSIAWIHLKKRWNFIVEKFGGGHLFSRFVTPLENFTTLEEAKDVENFFKKNAVVGIERSSAQAIELIKSNAAWIKRDLGKIEKFLKN